jgi:hypothetical protein
MKDKFSKPAYGSPAQKRPHNTLDKTLWNAMPKKDGWPCYKDQRWSDRHEEQVLHHMNGQEFVIQDSERRTHRDPDRSDTAHERCHISQGDSWKLLAKM